MTPEERVVYLVRLGMEAWDDNARRWAGERDMVDTREAFRAALEERMRQAAQTWTCEADADHVRTMTADHRRAIDALRRTHAAELSERYQRGYAAGLRVGRQGPPPPCPACGSAAYGSEASLRWVDTTCSQCGAWPKQACSLACPVRVGRVVPCGGTGAAHENDGSAPWDNPECSYCQGTGSKEPA